VHVPFGRSENLHLTIKNHTTKNHVALKLNPFMFCPADQSVNTDENINTFLSLVTKGYAADVGAYDGLDAIRYAQFGHTVHTFEPVSHKASRIKANILKSRHASKIVFHQVALSNVSGVASFTVNVPRGKPGKQRAPGTEQDAFNVPWKGVRTTVEKVKVQTLDEMFLRAGVDYLQLLKIDAQGHDGEVLLGARNLIQNRRIRFILFECSPNLSQSLEAYIQSVQLLVNSGYTCTSCGLGRLFHRGSDTVKDLSFIAFLEQLKNHATRHRGAIHGEFTNIVCEL